MHTSHISLGQEPPPAGGYSFPTLKAKQIFDCLADLQIPVTEEVLSAPDKNRDAVVRVLERLVEATMGNTREDMAQPQFAGLSALNFAELHEESIPELAFFRACSRMMEVSCVFDFSVNDLLHPTRQRLRRHLSAIINFCKFREERMMLYTQLAAQKEQCAMQASSLQDERVELERELAALKEQTVEEAKLTEELEHECSHVEGEIAACNRLQAEIRSEGSDLKGKGIELKDRLNSMSIDLKEVSLQRERLLGQIVNSPERIRREMADLQSALDSERQECMQCEKAAHQTELGIESANRAKGGVMATITALDEVTTELSKQRDAIREVKATHKSVEDNRIQAAAIGADLSGLGRQATRWEEKLAHLRSTSRSKCEAMEESMIKTQEELRSVETERAEGIARAEAAETESLRLAQALKVQVDQAICEQNEMLGAFQQLEAAMMAHSESLHTTMMSSNCTDETLVTETKMSLMETSC